ncbi:MAG: sigma factor-like helix-turn-helix DNA-binding protein [Alistipes shahii]
MSRIDGLTNREIAETLHIAQRTVEKHISISIRWFRRSPQFKGYWADSSETNDKLKNRYEETFYAFCAVASVTAFPCRCADPFGGNLQRASAQRRRRRPGRRLATTPAGDRVAHPLP